MPAAGLTDVYRYGARFVGYLTLVVLLGGVFVGGGIALGFGSVASTIASAGLNDPAAILQQLSLGSLAGALVLVAIGIVMTLVGVTGLVHKLIADAAKTGTEVAMANELDVAAVPAGGADATDGEAADQDASEAPEPAPEPDADAADEPEPDAPTEAVDEPDSEVDDETDDVPEPTPVEEPPAEETTEPEPVEEPPEATAADDGTGDADGPPEPTPVEEPPEAVDDQQTQVVTDDGESESTVQDDSDLIAEPAEEDEDPLSQPAPDMSTESEDVSATETDDGGVADGADEDAGASTEPQEWSPPDPSEFDGDEPPAEDEEARTTDDLFGDEERESADEPEDVTDLFGEEAEDETTATAETDEDSEDDPLSDPFDS